MTLNNRRAIASLIVAAATGLGFASAAYSQTTMSPDAASTPKAQHKAARKAHRAAKNAELKKLEQNGYNPGQNDPQYPNKLQNAEKKAGEQ